MTFIYFICFLLITVGVIILLRLNPEKITDDLMRFVSPKQTLREKVQTAKGKKRSRKLTVELNRIRDALEQTGKGGQFSIACAASVVLMILGCILAIMIDNAFLIPVFAIAFAMIPFAYAKRTVNYYDNHIKEELETSLSIITTSYVRTDDIVTAVKENMQHLKPPVKEIFAGFVAENMMISADIKQSIRHLKEKVSNSIFGEWCDTLIACQDDRTLKDTLMPIVSKLTDVRIVNNEIKGMLVAARTEYFMMAAMVVGNIPLLYFLNKDWYREHAGEDLRRELDITVADMRSGNYEVALTRLESRVGSSMMSDVTRGLISVIHGDKTDVYWGNLVLKFSDYQRTLLKNEANKAPKRVRKLSMALLFCFMLIYVVVIGQVLLSSLGGMFG